MRNFLKISLVAVLVTPVFVMSVFLTNSRPVIAGGVVDRTAEEKSSFLAMVCADFNMITRQGQRYCLQEMYGQSLEFAQRFFAAMDINGANKMQRIEEWRVKVGLDHPAKLTDEQQNEAEVDVLFLIGYGTTCQQLGDIIMDPEPLLGLQDKTVETLVGLPEYCVNQAITIARIFDLDIDYEDATQLSAGIENVRHYYELSPEIPRPRAGQKIALPDPV